MACRYASRQPNAVSPVTKPRKLPHRAQLLPHLSSATMEQSLEFMVGDKGRQFVPGPTIPGMDGRRINMKTNITRNGFVIASLCFRPSSLRPLSC